MKNVAFACVLLSAVAGCKKNDAPPRPANGAPVLFEVSNPKAGGDHKGSISARVYNFADETTAHYDVVIQYKDKDGKVLAVNKGTPFEQNFETWSFSGGSWMCDPKQWCDLRELDHLDVPEGAVTAAMLPTKITGTKDRVKIDDAPLWSGPEAWPGEQRWMDKPHH